MKKILLCLVLVLFASVFAKEFPVVFCQAQLKYPLDNGKTSGYFSNWNDWPLLVNSDFKPAKNGHMGKESFKFSRQIASQYGLSGFAFWQSFIRNRRRADFLSYAEEQPVDNFKFVPIISLSGLAKFEPEIDTPRLLKSPQILEINGKKLFWTYGINDSKKLLPLVQRMKKYGNNFVVVYGHPFLPEIREQSAAVASGKDLTSEVKTLIKNVVRSRLREFDGFAWQAMSTNMLNSAGEKSFNDKLYRKVLEVTAQVFNEPEFKGKKYFGSAAVAEHSNSGRLGHTLSSKGTLTLRQSLGIALELGAQLVNIPEWDEQNENTSLRPTAYNSFAYMRVIRYLINSYRREKNFSLPGDNLAIPNLIISYRKIAMYGEKLEIELLNVPDNSVSEDIYSVRLRFRTIEGKLVYDSGVKQFKSNKLMEYRPAIASEKLSGERLIIPELEITKGVKTTLYNQGFAPIQLQPTWCRDYKYVKQPLRDLLTKPNKLEWSFDAKRLEVKCKIDSAVPLRSVELLDCGDAVYSAGNCSIPRESNEKYAFRVQLVSLLEKQVSGSINVTGAKINWVTRSRNKGNRLSFKNSKVNHFFQNGGYFSLPKNIDPKTVFLELDFPKLSAVPKQSLDLLLKNGTTFLDLGQGVGVAVTRQLRQIKHGDNLQGKHVEFTIPLTPDMRHSVLQLQLVGEDGKLWRSNPLLSAKITGKKVNIVVWSDTEKRAVKIDIPQSLLPEIEYNFSADKGLAISALYGRPFWAMRGNYYNLATLRLGSGGGCSYGLVQGLKIYRDSWSKRSDSPQAPQLCANESNCLQFTSIENIAIPPGFMPRRAGFTFELSIYPQNMDETQYLLGCRRDYPGVLNDLWIQPNGNLTGVYAGFKRTKKFSIPAKIKAKEWNKIIIVCNLKELIFIVNGQKYPPVPIFAPGLYDMPTTIGCFEPGNGFKGKIKDVKMVHQSIIE